MTIYIDITNLEEKRANTGIQRVVKEFLQRAIKNTKHTYNITIYNPEKKINQLLKNSEVKLFLENIEDYEFQFKKDLDITTIKPTAHTVFFDIDSAWNSYQRRDDLYPILKQNGFLIFNFIYDLIPLVLPSVVHKNTISSFTIFAQAVYEHTDMVFFDSASANDDFLRLKQNYTKRDIPTRAVGLGSDFFKSDTLIVDDTIKYILSKKYILFVGTLEPRKNQEEIVDAFTILSQKYPDLNLVIIGKQGWDIESLLQKINRHPKLNKQLFWLNDIDDDTLNHFYQNAFIVTYLSKYEGYGLPIAESLNHGNITITSKNSSMYEVGHDYADYVVYNSINEIVDTISLYCEDTNLYNSKKEFIKHNYKSTSWDKFYSSLSTIFDKFQISEELKENHLKTLQFVFISIEYKKLQNTIKTIDKYCSFVKEYIIVTQPKLVEQFHKLTSINNITIIDETIILKEYAKDFAARDHVSKNWLLRTSLLNIENLDDEFIMLDDDNRPIKKLTLDTFTTKEGRYNAYYFYNLLEWNHSSSEYDKGQQNMKKVLSDKNYELLAYSSHCPQIINKKIFQESIELFFNKGLNQPIDEWSIYFNYAISTYPYLFDKKVFQTLHWPKAYTDWDFIYEPKDFIFENYYDDTPRLDYTPFKKTKTFFKQNKSVISSKNQVYGNIVFQNKNIKFILSSIPHFIVSPKNSLIRLKLNYKYLNLMKQNNNITLSIFLNNNHAASINQEQIQLQSYYESILELPISTKNLTNKTYILTFKLKVNDNYIQANQSLNTTKLIVQNENININLVEKKAPISLKEQIKSIPLIGTFARWCYNLLRLNNLKHNVILNSDKTEQQQKQINTLLKHSNYSKKQNKAKFAHLYQEFEDKFRGEKSIIKQRLSIYLPFLKTISFDKKEINIVDLGSGRGEWLELLRQHNYKAKGCDTNQNMINHTINLNLEVKKIDAISYLKSSQNNSISLITGFHIIEHLDTFDDILELLDESLRVLKPNGMIIFETPNPRNILVSSSDFYLDPTHQTPLHPLTMKFFTQKLGFKNVQALVIKDDMFTEIEEIDFRSINDYVTIGRDYCIVARK
ncbi:MAG: glycosyltransferase [Campylobacterota bacterium]|nr:glycosyltransferase [Campylobacterota bacterium]